MKKHKSLLGKLLANEDITIRVASVQTASFNPKTRTMLIPPWGDVTDDTADLLLGHEVGHALFTPADGWHDAVHNHPFPKSYVNIVEDVRIEKLIQSKYPGLRTNFTNGYKELLSRDFFGTNGTNINTMTFMNRLNVKSKCRDSVEVKFTKEEMVYVNKVYSCETFDDVIEVSNELYVWLKEKNKKAQAMNEAKPDATETCENPAEEGDTDQVEDEVTEGSNDPEESEEESKAGVDDEESEADAESEETETETEDSSADDPDAEKSKEESEGGETGEFEETEEPLDEDVDYTDASTDDEFRNKEDELVDTNNDGMVAKVIHIPTIDKVNAAVVSWELAAETRKERGKTLEQYRHGYHHLSDPTDRFFSDELEGEFQEANNSAMESANALVKEFERKKAAWETQRATESKRGSLNMVKLHQYKFSEDIFLSGLNTPNAKSHGVVALMDFSGSMGSSMGTMISQSYILAVFCKKAGIPFKFHSFTSGYVNGHNLEKGAEDEFEMKNILMVEQFSSDMSMTNLRQAYKILFKTWHRQVFNHSYTAAQCDSLGGTPLNISLAMMIPIIDNFKKSFSLQKVSFVTITDGQDQGNFLTGQWSVKKILCYKNKQIISQLGSNAVNPITDRLMKAIQDMGVKTIGYYIKTCTPNKYDLVPLVCASAGDYGERQGQYHANKVLREGARKTFRSNQMVEWHKAGYDSYAFIKGDVDMAANNEEFFGDITSESKKCDINKALQNLGKSKIFARAFAKSFTNVFA